LGPCLTGYLSALQKVLFISVCVAVWKNIWGNLIGALSCEVSSAVQ
jgi:hypothetical protein